MPMVISRSPLLQRLPHKFNIRVGVVAADWAERKSSTWLGSDIATRANALRLTLFGNDFINRAEYFAQRGPRPYDTAFHRLLLSVFESGLRDYLKAPKYRGDVRQWVNERGGCAPFGFESACEYLGLNCAAAREAMRKWMKKVDTSERHGRVARHRARLHRNRWRPQAGARSERRRRDPRKSQTSSRS